MVLFEVLLPLTLITNLYTCRICLILCAKTEPAKIHCHMLFDDDKIIKKDLSISSVDVQTHIELRFISKK